jgi:glycosyltransferase involved in cell wall biosynthesis
MSARTPERATAVSVTPIALDADSRAFRIACTLAEAGFRSIVVEGRSSSRQFWDDTIEVVSLAGPSDGNPGSALHEGALRRIAAALRQGRCGSIGEAVLYAGFRVYDWQRHRHIPGKMLPAADLYYLHSFELHRAVAPFARRNGARIIYDAHDFYRGIAPAEEQPSFDRRRLRPFYDELEVRLVAAADAVVTVSHGVADEMTRVFGRRPEIIRNCHDDRRDHEHAPDLRGLIGLAPADRLCVLVGNYKPGMAVDAAIAAIGQLPSMYHLAFVGRGYDEVRHRLPRGPLGSRIHLGHVFDPDKIVPAIRSADIGLLLYRPYSTNYRHALPNGFFQLVAAGLPIVRAPLKQVEDTIGGRQIGVCLEELHPAALAAAITKCSEMPDSMRRETAALAGELSWQSEGVRLQILIDSIMRQSQLAPAAAFEELVPRHVADA